MSSNEGLLMKVFSHSLMWLSKHYSGHYVTTQTCTLISWSCVHLRWCGSLEDYMPCKVSLYSVYYFNFISVWQSLYKSNTVKHKKKKRPTDTGSFHLYYHDINYLYLKRMRFQCRSKIVVNDIWSQYGSVIHQEWQVTYTKRTYTANRKSRCNF